MTAEELLMSEESEAFEYSNVITIDRESRAINVPLGQEKFGVEGDKNATLKHFSCPKIVGDNIDIDLSEHNLYANYTLADEKGNPKSEDVIQSPCENIVIGDDNITFDWKISEWVTREDGYIAFSIVAKKSVDGVLETRWYTTPAVGKILKTVKEGRYIEQQYPDVIDNLMNRVSDLERILANGGGSITVDDALSETSTNPVQNKVVTKEIRQLSEKIGDLKGSEVTGISAELTTALRLYFTNIQTLMPQLAYVTEDNVGNAIIQNAKDVVTVLGGGEAEEPTLSSISASYSGGDVVVGTALTALTGITVTGTYSDGSTSTITGYTLSGEIVEGSNTITVTYGGKTTTFTVVGVVESGGEDEQEPLYTLETASNVSLPDRYGNNPIEYSVSGGNHVEVIPGDSPSGSMYMDVNFSSAVTNGVGLAEAPEWFVIPSGATVIFKLTNVKTTNNSLGPNMNFGLREVGASETGMEYVLKVKSGDYIDNLVGVYETWENTTTIESETSISGICGDFNVVAGKDLQFDVELYVNGERWI